LYFFLSSWICGASALIFRVACICLMNSGTSSSRMKTTRMTMVSSQARPLAGDRKVLRPVWICSITHATASYRGFRGFVTTLLPRDWIGDRAGRAVPDRTRRG
jgi:hypothetical protein